MSCALALYSPEFLGVLTARLQEGRIRVSRCSGPRTSRFVLTFAVNITQVLLARSERHLQRVSLA